MMPIDVARNFALIRTACTELRGAEYCSDQVVQAIGAIARHETGFGTYSPFAKGTFASNNWGAQQCAVVAKAGVCPPGCFPATDTSPTSSGGSIPYLACFLVNDSPEAGARSLVRLVAVQRPGIAAALSTGDAQAIAQAMRDARYYEGFGKDQTERVANYAKALLRNAQMNAAGARVPLAITLQPPPEPPPPPIEDGDAAAAGFFGAFFAALVARITKAGQASSPD